MFGSFALDTYPIKIVSVQYFNQSFNNTAIRTVYIQMVISFEIYDL
jgi:hypothetical protein